MGEEVVADFTGKILTNDLDQLKPVKGRVLLSRDQLVLVTGEGKETILLSSIVSTNPSSVASGVTQFIEDGIAIAYEQNKQRKQAIVGGKSSTIAKFRTFLFRLLIGKQTVIATHPAKRGGRMTNANALKMVLALEESAITLSRDDKQATIDVESVIGFEHETRKMGDRTRPTLIVDHTKGDTTLTTFISLLSQRKLTFLSQFIRLHYSEVMTDLSEIEVGNTETEALVSLYSAGGNAPLETIITGDEAQAKQLLKQLQEKGLVTLADGGIELTSRGEVVVTEQLESVNE